MRDDAFDPRHPSYQSPEARNRRARELTAFLVAMPLGAAAVVLGFWLFGAIG